MSGRHTIYMDGFCVLFMHCRPMYGPKLLVTIAVGSHVLYCNYYCCLHKFVLN